jgi:glycosyltransferase involved in cell wall biosynthesis
MKHHILHVIDHTGGGGAQVVVQYILGALKHKFSFSVAVLGRAGEFSQTYKESGIPVFELGDRGSRWSPFSLVSLLNVIDEREPDLIHTHLYKSHIMGAVAARRKGSKAILHDHAGIYPQSLRHLFPSAVLRYTYLLAYRGALKQYDRILVLTSNDMKFYRQAYSSSHHKVMVLPNAVDLGDFGATIEQPVGKSIHQELGLPNETKLVMMIGRLDRQKDWPTFLRTAPLIQQRVDKYCAFLVVGSGAQEQNLRDYVAVHKVQGVFFLDYRRDVASLLHQADVFILTSRREPFGIVVLEAMAAGCPVVATRSGGPESIINHGLNGLLADVGDVDALANHVTRLLQDSALRRKLIRHGRETVSDQYKLETVSARLAKIYDEVLAS